MKKKVYTKDLSINEIIQRLNNGEKIYAEGALSAAYYQKTDGFLVRYEYDEPKYVNVQLNLDETGTPYPKYFLDEVEEPEADKSCIGKLCEFTNDDEIKWIRILKFITEDGGYKSDNLRYFKHCRPLTKEEALALVKE